jgi:hypothetical protein
VPITVAVSSSVTTMQVAAGWNLLGVSEDVFDRRKEVQFFDATSAAFSYAAASYRAEDSLRRSRGYWLKFPAPETVKMYGRKIESDSVAVATGWNTVGAISVAVATSDVISSPPGLVASPFYSFNGAGYTVADSLVPGLGYWIKSSANAALLLGAGARAGTDASIRIVETGERPPDPPGSADAGERPVPTEFRLLGNYPNPFNPSTVISYALPGRAHVRLRVFDLLGEEVATLVDEVQEEGLRSATFDGSGRASGVYYYRLQVGGLAGTGKLVLLR